MSEGRRQMGGLEKAIDKLFKVVEVVIAIFLAVMILFTFANVILRQFKLGFPWSEEITRICFIYLVYLGSIIAARENRHLMVDTLINNVPPMFQKILYVVIQGIIIWLMGVLAVGAFQNAWMNRNDFWVATRFPVFLVHFSGVLLGGSYIIISLVNLYRMIFLKVPVLELFGDHGEDGDSSEDLEEQEGGGLQ